MVKQFIKEVKFNDIWNNDARKVTEIYFDFPKECAIKLVEGKYKDIYEKALSSYKYKAKDIIPHVELQLSCPYGECIETVGSASLGIGITYKEGTEVLEIIDLLPGQDFDVPDILKLWSNALNNSKS